jgi:cytochrome c oxidase cbb3-type subunit 3/ubiquinol-cytochrome c reductase cytochrome c subunit
MPRPALVPLLGLALLGGCGQAEPRAPAARAVERDEAVREGRAHYETYCALCHGANGEGYAADNASQLANQDFLATASFPLLYLAIERGRPGTPMSAFGARYGGPLEPEAIAELIAYLRSWLREPVVDVDARVVTGDAARGLALYREHCASCHGAAGKGGKAQSLSDPGLLATASDGFLRHAIAHGRRGTTMPAFAGKLGEQGVDDVTAYLRSLARTVSDERAPDGAAGEVLPPAALTVERVVLSPGGPPADLGELRDGRYVPVDTVRAALAAQARIAIVDARPISDWLKAHIPGAVPVPYYDQARIEGLAAVLPRDTWAVIYCACPHAESGRVMDALRARGFSRTAVLDEGIFVWLARGYPLTYGVMKPPPASSDSVSAKPSTGSRFEKSSSRRARSVL